jgi:hypothetical protein
LSALSTQLRQTEGVPGGLLAVFAALGRAVSFPFDALLVGMVGAELCVELLCRYLRLTRDDLYEHIVRLGLRSPPDRPARKSGARGWSDRDVQILLYLRPLGVHPAVIGELLEQKRSASAVRAKWRRLGLTSPPRRMLFRPDAATLAALRAALGRDAAGVPSDEARAPVEAGSPVDVCGRAAGPVEFRLVPNPKPAVPPAKRARRSPRPARPAGQRELGLLGVVGGTEHQQPTIAPAPAAIPTTIEAVEYSNLTWMKDVPHLTRNRVAVEAFGLLFMSGLRYDDVATKTGLTPAAARTKRTLMGIPSDLDRKKRRREFDLEVALATKAENRLIVRKEIVNDCPPDYFWVESSDRKTHTAPRHRKRTDDDRMIEGRYKRMRIVTREELDARCRAAAPPFASDAARMSA